jgi:hypothetical protein
MTRATCSMRSAGVPNGMPSTAASCSASGRPAPSPTSNLPPESRSSDAVRQATSSGRCSGTASTCVPSRSVLVAPAATLNAVNGSMVCNVSGTSNEL